MLYRIFCSSFQSSLVEFSIELSSEQEKKEREIVNYGRAKAATTLCNTLSFIKKKTMEELQH